MRITFSMGVGVLFGLSNLAAPPPPAANELAAPFRVLAGGVPIDVDIGHAAPLVTDWNGDGKPDLLVGQFKDGKLRIYRNLGSETDPKFGEFAWFQAGGADARVPSG